MSVAYREISFKLYPAAGHCFRNALCNVYVLIFAVAGFAACFSTAFAREDLGLYDPFRSPARLRLYDAGSANAASAGFRFRPYRFSAGLSGETGTPDLEAAFGRILDSSHEDRKKVYESQLLQLRYLREDYLFSIGADRLPLEEQLEFLRKRLKKTEPASEQE